MEADDFIDFGDKSTDQQETKIDFDIFGEPAIAPALKEKEEPKITPSESAFDFNFFEETTAPQEKMVLITEKQKEKVPINDSIEDDDEIERNESDDEKEDENEEDENEEDENEEDNKEVKTKVLITKDIKLKEKKQRRKPKIKRLKRTKKIPKPSSIKDSLSFFRARTLFPKEFDFTTDGNLKIPDVEAEKGRIIELPYYIEKTPKEKQEYLDKVKSEISSIETEMDEKMQMLRDALEIWRETGMASQVIELQRDLARLDAQRTLKRDGERWTNVYISLENRQINFENRYDDKKVYHPVFALQVRDIPFTQLFNTTTERPVKQQEEDDELNLTEREETFLIFSTFNEDGGFLAPDSLNDFTYNGQVYTSLLQAFHAERAAFVKRADLRVKILQQKTIKDIRTWANRFTGNFDSPKERMIDILKAYVTQNPNIKEELINTNSDIIVYANPLDRLLGIGLSDTDDNALDREKWISPNILGEAWMTVREPLLRNEKIESQEGGSPIELDKEEDERIKEERADYFKGVNYRKKVSFGA
jgi:predicted NAD-dependent protein-ADP-ribosyltransferase YbiA (DUF1768 family)